MKRIHYYTAALALIVVSAQAATQVYFNDFNTYRAVDDPTENDLHLKSNGTFAIPQVWLNYAGVASASNIGVWYRGYSNEDNAWGTLQGTTNAAVRINHAPPDSSAGAGLKLGTYQGFDRYGVCNIGSTYNVNTNFTFNFRVKLYENGGEITVPANAATGTITVAMGYADDTSGLFVPVKSGAFDLNGTNWMDGSITVGGGSLDGAKSNALGQVAIIKIGKTWDTGNNTTNYQAWADWVSVDAYDPWADHVDDQELGTYDRTADFDLDGVDNFTEWAIGGDPKDPNDTGYATRTAIMDMNADGTNEFIQIFPRMTNYGETGAKYTFQTTDDLVTGTWSNQTPWVGSTNLLWNWQPVDSEGFGPGYDAVSNIYVSSVLTSNDVYFFKLNIGHNDYNP